MSNETLDLGAMLEDTLDDIPEAPDFVTPPPGIYRLTVKDCKIDTYKAKPKDNDPGGERQRLKILYVIEQTVEVSGNEPPVPDGSMFNETFTGTSDGLSYFKKRIKAILNASDMSGVTFKDMMEAAKGVSFDARITTKKSANPDNPLQPYENVQIAVIAPKQ
jgi:hypothetical protein